MVISELIRGCFLAVYPQCILCGVWGPRRLTHLMPSSSVGCEESQTAQWKSIAVKCISKSLSFFFPLHLQLPRSSKGDFPSPGADLSSAVCDSLPTSEPAQCHPRGQTNQVCFYSRCCVYNQTTESK